LLQNKTIIREGNDVHISSLIKKFLNVNDIVIEDVCFEVNDEDESLVIKARPTKAAQGRCGICDRKSKGYDGGNATRRWRSLDLGAAKTFIEAPARRVRCKEHGVVAAKVPWARHGARMTYAFEDTVAWMMLHMSRSTVSSLMRVAWNTAGHIAKRVHDDLKGANPGMFDNLRRIGIDETSYKKGHKYMTVIVNHDTGALIWAAKGHGKKVLDAFFVSLNPEQKASIRYVTADGARWIADSVREHCPNAERCIDPFHVVGWATEALDGVRRDAWRDAMKESYGVKTAKKKPGRAKKGQGKPGKRKGETVKGLRYALLKNPDALTAGQAAAVEMIAKSDGRLYRAYLLKEKLRLLLKLPLELAAEALDGWIKWARRCRIPQFVELQKKIARHKDAITATVRHGLSNARVEAVNNKIKLTVRIGYGFRNIDNLIALVMLRCSGIKLTLPGRA
jgi:transposase